jgi:hypothetical protein
MRVRVLRALATMAVVSALFVVAADPALAHVLKMVASTVC